MVKSKTTNGPGVRGTNQMNGPHLFELKKEAFVLWYPMAVQVAPALVIGTFQHGNPPTLAGPKVIPLSLSPHHRDLWMVPVSSCGLEEGQVYHYWFDITDSNPAEAGLRVRVSDPTAFTVDWRLLTDPLAVRKRTTPASPASVIKWARGELRPCDADGVESTPITTAPPPEAPSNECLVIYELPTSWAMTNAEGNAQICVGTFLDVRSLVEVDAGPANLTEVESLLPGRSHLQELGINALQMLPIADSWVEREWGYATSNYFAPDHDLGFPEGFSWPRPNADLRNLVDGCHRTGIRFIIDFVMGFATRAPLEKVNFPVFHLIPRLEPGNPDAYQSSRGGAELRDGFGGVSWRYLTPQFTYDPISGKDAHCVPARQYLKAHLLRWMSYFGADGIRVDSVNNIANWDFVREFRTLAHETWRARGGEPDRFIVLGEELAMPAGLLEGGYMDALWNEHFRWLVRQVIRGMDAQDGRGFGAAVQDLIDCRRLGRGVTRGTQVINYLGSHDVGNSGGERLYNFLENAGIHETEQRIKLAFVCLLTAVGIPMIFAGDEFADQHDLSWTTNDKQLDAVNFERLADPWRRRIFEHVSRLVKLRTSNVALAQDETDFIHFDFSEGKRVVCWRRGRPGARDQVVVVANFSGYGTPDPLSPQSRYEVPRWPATPPGCRWIEVTQARSVPPEWVGVEPLFPWEAKVYVLVS